MTESGQGECAVTDPNPLGQSWTLLNPLTPEWGLISRLVVEYPIFHEAYEGFNDQCMYCGVEPEYVSPCKTDPKWPNSSHYHVTHKSDCAWIAGMTYLRREIDHMHLVAL